MSNERVRIDGKRTGDLNGVRKLQSKSRSQPGSALSDVQVEVDDNGGRYSVTISSTETSAPGARSETAAS